MALTTFLYAFEVKPSYSRIQSPGCGETSNTVCAYSVCKWEKWEQTGKTHLPFCYSDAKISDPV